MTDQAARPAGPGPAAAQEAPPGGFVGRDRELRELHAEIGRAGLGTLSGRPSPHSRVLLIAGRPGSGRTALAEEFVRRHADDYPGGVLRVRLTDPGGAPVPVERTARDLLASLGAEPAPAGADEDELLETVRGALGARKVLLLLDDIARAEQLLDLLPDSRDCLVVAVGEGPLTGANDVRPCAIGGLDRAAAVQLLGSRAGKAPRATVDPRSAEALAEVCGDLPAALAMAGGWLAARPKLSVADAAKQLAAPDEPDPLRRVFRLVHDSLAPAAARMLRLLTLAPVGAVDPHTSSALAGCSVAAARSTLEDFVGLGLLQRTTGPEQYELPRCLDPLLRERLEQREKPGEVLLARARMLERTVRQLQACRAVTEPHGSPARKRLEGMPRALRFTDAAAARGWLEARRPALLACARLAVGEVDGQLDTLARRLISALARAFDAHRSPQESAPELYRLHELVLDVAERVGLPREGAAALLNLGDLDAGSGRLEQALTRYRAALDASRADGRDGPATGRALESIGGTYAELSDWARAADWYGRALTLRLAHREREAAARLHGRLGAVHTYAGRFGEALREWKAAAAAHRRLRNPQGHARALSEVARVQEYAGRPHESLRTCRQALAAAQRAGDTRLEAALLVRLADACDRVGESAEGHSHRAAAGVLLDEGPAGERGRPPGEGAEAEPSYDRKAKGTYEIHSGSEKD
ncbi:tetratricopeptide repeat protein [Streptomyces sp. ODS28]|uniref:tetratricopeptide repeat protein n=1 Tax=Streptomyces sp. ODS28 TaxID=3136688 RepID=UPI0031E7E07D